MKEKLNEIEKYVFLSTALWLWSRNGKRKEKKKWWKYNSIPASLELYLLTYTLINYLTEHNEIKGNCIENEITKNSWRTH